MQKYVNYCLGWGQCFVVVFYGLKKTNKTNKKQEIKETHELSREIKSTYNYITMAINEYNFPYIFLITLSARTLIAIPRTSTLKSISSYSF